MHVEGIVIIVLILVLTIIAYGLWQKALYHLRHNELAPILEIKNARRPNSLAQARTILSNNDNSISVTTIHNALETGKLDITNLEYYHWIHWPRYLAGIFVFIGLLGTVWGIATAISSLGSTVGLTANMASSSSGASNSLANFHDQWMKVMDGISRLLSGMRAASYCTLFGLFATVIVSVLNSYYLSLCERLTLTITELANSYFLPLRTEDHQREEERTAIEDLKSAIHMLEGSANMLTNGVAPVVDYFNKVVNQVSQLGENLNGITNQAHHMVEQMALATQSIDKSSERSSQQMVNASQQIDTTLARSEQAFGSYYKSLQDTVTAFGEATQQLLHETQTVTGNSDEVGRAAAQMTQAVRTLQEGMVDVMNRQEKNLDTNLSRIIAMNEKLESHLRHFEVLLLDATSLLDSSPLQQAFSKAWQHVADSIHQADERDTQRNLQLLQKMSVELQKNREQQDQHSQAKDNLVITKLHEEISSLKTILKMEVQQPARAAVANLSAGGNGRSNKVRQNDSFIRRLLNVFSSK